MSFWPLATTLLDELRRGATVGPVLELGAGQGQFARVLASYGMRAILLDRLPFVGEARTDIGRGNVQASALELPFGDASLGAVVCANLVRSIAEADRSALMEEVARTLAPEGRCVVIEDEPEATEPAAIHYREVLLELARVDISRGGALPASAVEELLLEIGPETAAGVAENETVVQEPLRPVHWLRSRCEAKDRERIAALEESVRADGMKYGDYWYRVHRRGGR